MIQKGSQDAQLAELKFMLNIPLARESVRPSAHLFEEKYQREYKKEGRKNEE